MENKELLLMTNNGRKNFLWINRLMPIEIAHVLENIDYWEELNTFRLYFLKRMKIQDDFLNFLECFLEFLWFFRLIDQFAKKTRLT